MQDTQALFFQAASDTANARRCKKVLNLGKSCHEAREAGKQDGEALGYASPPKICCARKKTRTSTAFQPPAPEAGASTNFAIRATARSVQQISTYFGPHGQKCLKVAFSVGGAWRSELEPDRFNFPAFCAQMGLQCGQQLADFGHGSSVVQKQAPGRTINGACVYR